MKNYWYHRPNIDTSILYLNDHRAERRYISIDKFGNGCGSREGRNFTVINYTLLIYLKM
jgi:hypothetical protein